MKNKEKTQKNPTDWLKRIGYKDPIIDKADIPKALQTKISRDTFLFIGIGLIALYIGIRYDSVFLSFGIIIMISGPLMLKIGVEYAATRGQIKEITGAIINVEYENIPLTNHQLKILNKFLYIEDENKNVYRIKISEKKRKYDIGYICTFYVKENLVRKLDGYFDCGTPLVLTLVDMSI